MQRPPGESMLTVFRDEQGGRSGQEVEGGDEIQILVGDHVGPEIHSKVSGFNFERDGQSLQGFEQRSDVI